MGAQFTTREAELNLDGSNHTKAYLNAAGNADLLLAFGTDYEAATQHYIEYGFGEGRAAA